MGLFYNPYKPGKGVSKDETFKNIFDKYFKLLWRKFARFIGLNLLYLLVALPVAMLIAFVASPIIASINWQEDMLSLYVYIFCMFCVWVGIAPINMGLCYVFRQFAREAPVWVVSDFFGKIKENFGKALIILLADLAFITLMFVNFTIFESLQYSSYIYTLSRLFIYVAIVLFIMLHFYIYQIILNFETTVRGAYKNALIFAMAKLPQSLLLLAITFVAGWLFIFYPWLAIPFGITPLGFAVNIYADKVMTDYISKNLPDKDEQAEEDADFADDE